ncbi:hypothetical protein V1264_008557 [Littorina saxatilis]|uniref:Uncharacterized protein n=1 Tax=Littorina saxatilis TaxID=31220 RepID=A0AAN9ATB6_9CAEN
MNISGSSDGFQTHRLIQVFKIVLSHKTLHVQLVLMRGYSSVGSALDLYSVGRCQRQREFDPRFGGNLFHRVNFVCRLSSVSEPPPVYTTLGVHVKDPTIDKRVFPGKIA